MPGTATAVATGSTTYTTLDVEKVMRRVGANLIMLADSTGCWTSAETANYVHDVEELAKAGYLKHVDITLLTSNGAEFKATRFVVDTAASGLVNQRPGDALWPKLPNARLRIILSYNPGYDDAARAKMKPKLKIGWVPSYEDTSHAALTRGGERTYASNAFGIQRLDWAA
jgi:hypothetical protein